MFGRQIILFSLFVSCWFLHIRAHAKTEYTKWPSDGALVVLGGCLYGEGPCCDIETADIEVLAPPNSIPQNCTIPPPFPVTSFNHGTAFFNNTIISCGLSSFHNKSCLTWRPGDTQWNVEYNLTARMHKADAVVTSYGAWFMDFGGEVSNVLKNTEGNFEHRPPPTLSPRMNPCLTTHPESDTVIVISGYMYKENSTVEMYTGNMTFLRYLPQLYPHRQSHSCGSIGDFIVVAGGNGWEDNCFNSFPLDTVQVLNLASNEGWIEYPPLENRMYNGIMANLLGSLVIVGGTEEINRTEAHNISITNHFLLGYPFERSSVVTTREQGHSVLPLRINDICNRKT